MRLMKVQWLALLLALVTVIGCSSPAKQKPAEKPNLEYSNRWSSSATPADLGKTGHLIEPQPAAEMGYSLSWAGVVVLEQGQQITSVTVLDDMVIVIEDPVNIVTALSTNDGSLLWKINLGSDLESLFPPTRDGKQVFIHSGTRIWTLHTKDGSVKALADLTTTVSSPGVYSPLTRVIVMMGTNGLIFAHNTVSNFPIWRYRLPDRLANPAVLADQYAFVVDTSGTYAMIESGNGRPLWRNHTIGDVTALPAVSGSEVIVSSEDGKIYAFNRTTGRDTWIYLGAEQPLYASPIAVGRLVVQPLTPNPGIIAIDSITGNELWRTDLNATPVMSRSQDMLMFNANGLFGVDLDNGKVTSEAQTLPIMGVKPVGDDGAIILVGQTGRLLKLRPL